MSNRVHTQVQAQQKTLTGSSPSSPLLQRTCACGGSSGIDGLCAECRDKRLTLPSSRRGFEAPSASSTAQGNSSAQDNVTSSSVVIDRASRFGHDLSQIPIHSTQTAVPQTKLKINQPGDVYEQEAEQVAEQVMRMADPGFSRPDDKEQAEKSLMRKQDVEPQANASAISSIPPLVDNVLNSSRGKPLDGTTRAFMEPRFGHDFSQVRVYTDELAAKSAQAVSGLAYTVGRDVVFGAGQYEPGTTQGRRLLAHELTHVVQQQKAEMSQPGDTNEQDADRVAQQVISTPHLAPTGMILPYREKKGSLYFGRENELVSGLVEVPFRNSKTQPWIEHITVKFNKKPIPDTDDPEGIALVAKGELEAIYHKNEAARDPIKVDVTGGSTMLGLTDANDNFTVESIEGVGYNSSITGDDPDTGRPVPRVSATGPGHQYTRDPDPKSKLFRGASSMSYAVFFLDHLEALHFGDPDKGSHACIHVPNDEMRQINFHSVEHKTKISVSYPAFLTELCCARQHALEGSIRNPCKSSDVKGKACSWVQEKLSKHKDEPVP